MKKNFKVIGFLFLSALISCGGDASTEVKADGNDSLFKSENTVNAGTNISTEPAKTIETVPGVEKKTGGINPAHGQPGHVCEAAVGAVIPDKLPASNITTQATTPIQPIQSITPLPNTKPGLNPAHGQPGHRCDIAVGAPLTDVAAKTSNDPNSNYPVVSSPMEYKAPLPFENKTITLPEANTKVAAGMNPAHGQPGHRCDIAVSAPLNKKSDNN